MQLSGVVMQLCWQAGSGVSGTGRGVPSGAGGLIGAEAEGQGPPSKDWPAIHLLPAQQGTPVCKRAP